ncbi:MAG: hypothetical protein KBS79_03210, partial [Lachnospiraceae bacterium]|nr:hypothetical protein [Candidatus Minthocola equi]
MRKPKRIVSFSLVLITVLLCCLFVSGCEAESSGHAKFTEISDFNGTTVASQTGTVFDQTLSRCI